MADQPIDTTDTPFVNVACVACGTWVIAVPERVDMAMCLDCRRSQEGIDWPWFTAEGDWHPSVGYPAPGSAGVVSEPRMHDFRPAEYEIGPNLTVFADVDGVRDFGCLICRQHWPMIFGVADDQMGAVLSGHHRTFHAVDVWLVGGPGGSRHGVCAPCGGGNRDKTRMPGGPDHSKCLSGRIAGRSGLCDCKHRSRDEIDAIVGKTGSRWRPPRWSDPKIVELAAENVKKRCDQLNLWEEDPK